jgi:DNA-binding transcriptional ArsR family regulator
MAQPDRQLPHPAPGEVGLGAVLAALSDPVRLAIVARLARTGECAWGEFELGVCKSTLSHHMKVLREAGLIRHRREGTHCRVAPRPEIERDFPGLLDTVLGLADAVKSRASGIQGV